MKIITSVKEKAKEFIDYYPKSDFNSVFDLYDIIYIITEYIKELKSQEEKDYWNEIKTEIQIYVNG